MTWFDKDWLDKRVSIGEVEAGFEGEDSPCEDWLKSWTSLKEAMQEGDELWTYCSPAETWEHLCGRAGYAVVRDGEIVDDILTEMN